MEFLLAGSLLLLVRWLVSINGEAGVRMEPLAG